MSDIIINSVSGVIRIHDTEDWKNELMKSTITESVIRVPSVYHTDMCDTQFIYCGKASPNIELWIKPCAEDVLTKLPVTGNFYICSDSEVAYSLLVTRYYTNKLSKVHVIQVGSGTKTLTLGNSVNLTLEAAPEAYDIMLSQLAIYLRTLRKSLIFPTRVIVTGLPSILFNRSSISAMNNLTSAISDVESSLGTVVDFIVEGSDCRAAGYKDKYLVEAESNDVFRLQGTGNSIRVPMITPII